MAIGIPHAESQALEACENIIDTLEYLQKVDREAISEFEIALSHIAEEGGLVGAYAALVLDSRARREGHKDHAALEAHRYRVDVLGLAPLPEGEGEPE
jgi:hypothetical protein